MKISVVTISYNQARFLPATIESVLAQDYPNVEYIICDPGSSDGSRDVIKSYASRLTAIVEEKDAGAADGLNRGFARATGDIFYYLNSDDVVEPGAFSYIVDAFASRPNVDVLCGHGWLIDEGGVRLRRLWSDPFNPVTCAYGTGIQIQPSTFIRRRAFEASGGFNAANKISWDGELLIDLYKTGAVIKVLNAFLSGYRVHGSSITGTGALDDLARLDRKRRFERITGRPWQPGDETIRRALLISRQLRNPAAFVERLAHGPAYMRAVKRPKRTEKAARADVS